MTRWVLCLTMMLDLSSIGCERTSPPGPIAGDQPLEIPPVVERLDGWYGPGIPSTFHGLSF